MLSTLYAAIVSDGDEVVAMRVRECRFLSGGMFTDVENDCSEVYDAPYSSPIAQRQRHGADHRVIGPMLHIYAQCARSLMHG